MEKGYTSVLTKPILAYNLAYHLKKAQTERDIFDIINHILNSFEYKEEEKSE
jgi:hypothetical protein